MPSITLKDDKSYTPVMTDSPSSSASPTAARKFMSPTGDSGGTIGHSPEEGTMSTSVEEHSDGVALVQLTRIPSESVNMSPLMEENDPSNSIPETELSATLSGHVETVRLRSEPVQTKEVNGADSGDKCPQDPPHPVPEVFINISSSQSKTQQSNIQRSKFDREEVELRRRLDLEYDRALEEREVAWNARYSAVLQGALINVIMLLVFFAIGLIYYIRYEKWNFVDTLIFITYTYTTVGYGNISPTTTESKVFTTFYLLIGIALTTNAVAQIFQWVTLEATRAQFSRDKDEIAKRAINLMAENEELTCTENANRNLACIKAMTNNQKKRSKKSLQFCLVFWRNFKHFLQESRTGRCLYIMLPLFGLVAVGATVFGLIEGLGFVDSVYWAVVTLSTVGYGDYYPTQLASKWFCVCYLPLALFFLSFYISHIATLHMFMHTLNISRLEAKLREKIKNREGSESLGDDKFLTNESTHENSMLMIPKSLSGESSPPVSPRGSRRLKVQRLKRLSLNNENFEEFMSEDDGDLRKNINKKPSVSSMRDVINSVKSDTFSAYNFDVEVSHNNDLETESGFLVARKGTVLSSTNSDGPLMKPADDGKGSKPSFALRAIVQERMAYIIANDVAGYQDSVTIKENTLSIEISNLKQTCEKWFIPRRARKAFRAVAFEALFFVGEHGLITRGAAALFDLSPIEFHALFAPLIAAMGSSRTVETWLATTNLLAEVETKRLTQSIRNEEETMDLDLQQDYMTESSASMKDTVGLPFSQSTVNRHTSDQGSSSTFSRPAFKSSHSVSLRRVYM